MLEISLLSSRDQVNCEVDLRLEREMELHPPSFYLLENGSPGERTFSPDESFDVWIPDRKGMRDHASNVMANDVDWLGDVDMILKKVIQVVSKQSLV